MLTRRLLCCSVSALLTLAAATASQSAIADPVLTNRTCKLLDADQAWLTKALENWKQAEGQLLMLSPMPFPDITVVDAHCTYFLRQGRFEELTAQTHGNTATLSDGSEIPIAPVSFANGANAFVMTLPSVWRAAGVSSEFGLERLMEGVLLHEMMHTRQAVLANAALEPIARANGLEDTLNDDIVQEQFKDNSAYVAAYETERDTFFAATRAESQGEALRLARQGLKLLRSRRATYFANEESYLADLDDIFLTMEGMGQWLSWRFFLSPEGGRYDLMQVEPAVRRGGAHWSQDEGLAIILVIDRLLPGWQKCAFMEPEWRAERLLTLAVGEESPDACAALKPTNSAIRTRTETWLKHSRTLREISSRDREALITE